MLSEFFSEIKVDSTSTSNQTKKFSKMFSFGGSVALVPKDVALIVFSFLPPGVTEVEHDESVESFVKYEHVASPVRVVHVKRWSTFWTISEIRLVCKSWNQLLSGAHQHSHWQHLITASLKRTFANDLGAPLVFAPPFSFDSLLEYLLIEDIANAKQSAEEHHHLKKFYVKHILGNARDFVDSKRVTKKMKCCTESNLDDYYHEKGMQKDDKDRTELYEAKLKDIQAKYMQ